MKYFMLILSITLLSVSCNRVKNKANDTINKGGEVVGESATNLIEGISEGVEKSLDCEIIISDELKAKGISTGTYSIKNHDLGGHKNLLLLYVIFEKDFRGDIMAKAFNKQGQENGRKKQRVEGRKGDARYIKFPFEEHTRIEAKSKIELSEVK